MVGPWSRATAGAVHAAAEPVRAHRRLIVVLLPLAAAVIARRNVRSGRADARAPRLTGGVFTIDDGLGLQTHIELLDVETGRLAGLPGLFNGAAWRRLSCARAFVPAPDMLITWSRVSGRVFDHARGSRHAARCDVWRVRHGDRSGYVVPVLAVA
jgi:hypothetical protein